MIEPVNTKQDKRRFVLQPEGLPDLSALMLFTIEALKDLGGSGANLEIVNRIIEREGITEEEQSYLLPNDRDRRLDYYLSWARTYLKRGGALENSARAVWTLTPKGEAITDFRETESIREQVNAEERERARLKRLQDKSDDKIDDLNKILIEDGPSNQPPWDDELISVLLEITPDGFERLAQRLLREAGFVKVEVRGKSGDGGIDGVGILRVNLVSFQVYFQCKRWANSVGAKDIRDFRGALQGRADKGLFITTSSFTKQAMEEATRDGAIAIDLIDGERLCQLLKQYELGVSTRQVEEVNIDANWFREI